LHTGYTDIHRTISDPGIYRLPNVSRPYRDWKKGGHGRVDLTRAIAESCDIYFYDLGTRMGIDKIHEFGSHFGLGELTGLDVPHERKGVWPSRAWKRSARGQAWYPGDTVNMSIGQGFVLTTPLQLAVMTATIANRGKRIRPQLVKAIATELQPPVVLDEVQLSDANWDAVFAGMAEVMRPDGRGTGKTLSKNADYLMAGKSGTAQVVGMAQDAKYDSATLLERHRDHALFIAFAPLDDPQIAVGIIVENGEHGSTAAGPVARYVFDAYLKGYYLTPGEFIPPMGYHSQAIIDRANQYIKSRATTSEAAP
jgi:penicillin-binding protein 2